MNKILKVSIALLLGLCICGCGGDTADTSSQAASEVEASETASTVSDNTSSTSSQGLTEEQIMMSQYLMGGWNDSLKKLNQMGEGKFIFGVQTDLHHKDTTENPEYMRNLAATTYFADFDFISVLGDIVRGYTQDVDNPNNMRECMDDVVARYTMANSPVLITVGNHDANHMWTNKHMPGDYTTLISEKEHYSRVVAPIKEHNGDNMIVEGENTYYYMDFPEDNVRVVMLNTSNGKFSESMSSTAMVSEEQIDWLINKALDTDKYVIVMSHIPFYWPEGKEGAGEASVKNGGLVLQAVENFISDGGKFVGYFHGHMHERTIHIDDNGRFHMGFMQGGNPGEAVMIDFEEKSVTSIILGNGKTREVRF